MLAIAVGDHQFIEWFNKNNDIYHPHTVEQLKRMLDIKEDSKEEAKTNWKDNLFFIPK